MKKISIKDLNIAERKELFEVNPRFNHNPHWKKTVKYFE